MPRNNSKGKNKKDNNNNNNHCSRTKRVFNENDEKNNSSAQDTVEIEKEALYRALEALEKMIGVQLDLSNEWDLVRILEDIPIKNGCLVCNDNRITVLVDFSAVVNFFGLRRRAKTTPRLPLFSSNKFFCNRANHCRNSNDLEMNGSNNCDSDRSNSQRIPTETDYEDEEGEFDARDGSNEINESDEDY